MDGRQLVERFAQGDEVVVQYYGPALEETQGPPETPPGQEKKQEDEE